MPRPKSEQMPEPGRINGGSSSDEEFGAVADASPERGVAQPGPINLSIAQAEVFQRLVFKQYLQRLETQRDDALQRADEENNSQVKARAEKILETLLIPEISRIQQILNSPPALIRLAYQDMFPGFATKVVPVEENLLPQSWLQSAIDKFINKTETNPELVSSINDALEQHPRCETFVERIHQQLDQAKHFFAKAGNALDQFLGDFQYKSFVKWRVNRLFVKWLELDPDAQAEATLDALFTPVIEQVVRERTFLAELSTKQASLPSKQRRDYLQTYGIHLQSIIDFLSAKYSDFQLTETEQQLVQKQLAELIQEQQACSAAQNSQKGIPKFVAKYPDLVAVFKDTDAAIRRALKNQSSHEEAAKAQISQRHAGLFAKKVQPVLDAVRREALAKLDEIIPDQEQNAALRQAHRDLLEDALSFAGLVQNAKIAAFEREYALAQATSATLPAAFQLDQKAFREQMFKLLRTKASELKNGVDFAQKRQQRLLEAHQALLKRFCGEQLNTPVLRYSLKQEISVLLEKRRKGVNSVDDPRDYFERAYVEDTERLNQIIQPALMVESTNSKPESKPITAHYKKAFYVAGALAVTAITIPLFFEAWAVAIFFAATSAVLGGAAWGAVKLIDWAIEHRDARQALALAEVVEDEVVEQPHEAGAASSPAVIARFTGSPERQPLLLEEKGDEQDDEDDEDDEDSEFSQSPSREETPVAKRATGQLWPDAESPHARVFPLSPQRRLRPDSPIHGRGGKEEAGSILIPVSYDELPGLDRASNEELGQYMQNPGAYLKDHENQFGICQEVSPGSEEAEEFFTAVHAAAGRALELRNTSEDAGPGRGFGMSATAVGGNG